MRTSATIGLALLAAIAGYGLSTLTVEPARAELSGAAVQNSATNLQPSSGTSANSADASVERTLTRKSFVHEGPNVASMTAPATFAALPPDSMPLAQSIDALASAMRSGSREATLRLLRQTKECANYRDARRHLDFALGVDEANKTPGGGGVTIISSEPGKDNKSIEGMIRGSAGAVAGSETRCAAFEDADDALRFEAQWRAALLGEIEGLLSFSLDPAIDIFRAFEQADRIERYRDRVLGFMNQALTQHSAQAVANLMQAYNPEWVPTHLRGDTKMPAPMRAFMLQQEAPTPLRQVTGNDALLAYRYARLCERVCADVQRSEAEQITASLRAGLKAADRERAEAEATELRERHFPDAERAEWIRGLGDEPTPPAPPGS